MVVDLTVDLEVDRMVVDSAVDRMVVDLTVDLEVDHMLVD